MTHLWKFQTFTLVAGGIESAFCMNSLIFLGSSNSEESARSEGDLGSIPGLGRFPGEGRGNPLQHSCLKNPMDKRSLVGYSPWSHKECDMTELLHFHEFPRLNRPSLFHVCFLNETWIFTASLQYLLDKPQLILNQFFYLFILYPGFERKVRFIM